MADEQATGVAGAVPGASGATGDVTEQQESEAGRLDGQVQDPEPDPLPDPQPDPLPTNGADTTGTTETSDDAEASEQVQLSPAATAAEDPESVPESPVPASAEPVATTSGDAAVTVSPAAVAPDDATAEDAAVDDLAQAPVEAAPPVPAPGPPPEPVARESEDAAAPEQPVPASPASEVAELPTVPAATDDPSQWGRVDADGTVYTVAPEGERAVGSWQAGDAVEGLAHYARRFDDLRTEADLLVRRLHSGRGDAANVLRSATVLRERLDVAAVVGDLPGLVVRLDAVITAAEQTGRAEKSAKAGAREQAVARKESLIGEAETLAEETTRWKHAGDRFSAMLEEWKSIRGIDRKTDDALWKRFAKARETFTRRRGAHFAELDRERAAAKARKEELVVEAESLQSSEDWGATAGRYKELMTEWKAAGRTSKDADDALWARFRGAQDAFFSRRSATFDARDAEFTQNATAKESLLKEAATIDLSDTDAARAALRSVQERWDEIGKVPRERVREFQTRLKEVEDRVRAAVDKRWSRTDPEKEARVGQFRERVEAYEAQAAKARAAGDERRAKEAEQQASTWREWLAAAERATG
ncbi:hypothetical protein Acsp07_54500 [Actinomycetospora sp. NBRC 106378]|nr:hypothetical protein Acsp07_54500 [Actinomycetospora sp. NBRC 106378]